MRITVIHKTHDIVNYMRPKFLLILLFLSFNSIIYSQETSSPLTDTEIVRNVSILDIEGKQYKNVTVTLKSISPDYYFSDKTQS